MHVRQKPDMDQFDPGRNTGSSRQRAHGTEERDVSEQVQTCMSL